ncbi:MAG TPA: DUF4132 domain-containing protein, partial [Herpetosiphonaceae bacterium]
MFAHQIRQPFKQAFREVYLLTEAELRTRTYSNRMAAHLLKQHQFNTLAAGRGWRYKLLGAYDDGRDGEIARLDLPAHGLQAQYWINDLLGNYDDFNDAGIWLYVATDQVRFVRGEEPVELISVPPIVFSEAMRDVDLFVGVASVGNDPQWRDSGGTAGAHRAYWDGYAFGDLTESAKERKAILERLLPRLTLAPVSKIEGKFLVVRGKLRTYKIHLGSSNILMEPNDQYLCIVPSRSQDDTAQVFLPFEGDRGLSLVLSKAFLLANDDRITDPTITRQIG